jgi:3-oxoacyl-[acyl-carrier protein] reductase
VTGAASGIGAACARALAAEGANVVCADIDRDGALFTAHETGGLGVETDVTDPASCEELVSVATSTYRTLDVLVTSAGVFHATPIDRITPDEWDRIQSVNLKGTFLVCQAALRVMVPQGSGRIVTIASLGGQTGGLAAGAGYVASKAGVVALTKSIARFAGRHGIAANTVNPGVIDTPITRSWPDDARTRVIAGTPLGRMGTPEEVAGIVVMLSSEAARFVHGAHVDVNGGLLMD